MCLEFIVCLCRNFVEHLAGTCCEFVVSSPPSSFLTAPQDVSKEFTAAKMNLDFAACIASGQGRTPPAVPRRCVCQLLCLLATRERHRLPPAAAWTEPGLVLGSRAPSAALPACCARAPPLAASRCVDRISAAPLAKADCCLPCCVRCSVQAPGRSLGA